MDQDIKLSRRSLLLGAAATTTPLGVSASPVNSVGGLEGQRKPDQGNGTPLDELANQFEVSGYHHDVAGDLLSLRPAIHAAGTGGVCIRDVRCAAL